jgi:hypothetical protein
MRFQHHIKEATYAGDKLFRGIAMKAYDKVKKILDKAYKQWEKDGVVPFKEHKNSGGWVITGNKFGYPDLAVILSPTSSYGGSGYSASGTKVRGQLKIIVIDTLMEPFNFKYANTRFNKRDFVHEFIHYLDGKRGHDDQNTATLLKTKGEKAYYNTPAEFNAYFQEGAQETEDLFKGVAKAKPSHLQVMLASFDTFKHWVTTKSGSAFFSKHWFDALEGKWKKKFLKRLYTLYKAMVKEYI